MIRYITILIIMLTSIVLQAQEVLTGLGSNPQILNAIKEGRKLDLKNSQVLTLPFFDDFSGSDIFPDSKNWANNDVFINNDYPVFPVTAGVATFDALDENGKLHSDADKNSFIADYLISHTIRLDSVFSPEPKALNPKDSIYLSFYYQPEGLGFAPSEGDSLVLEFFYNHPVDSLKTWIKVWSAAGMTLNEFYALNQTYFKRVMIPITDEKFLNEGFRFRFYNIASIRYPNAPSHQSNRDQWNIDYVYLNYNRSSNDIYYNDLAFVNNPGSFLKNYSSMPYKQYKQNFVDEMAEYLNVMVSNLNNTAASGSYKYLVSRPNGTELKRYESGSYLIAPFSQSGYVTEAAIAKPPVEFAFPIDMQENSASFLITHILTGNTFIPGTNDTLKHTQSFSDYYAYDDGTAEAGYGLTNAGGKMAYRFRLNTPDTLTAVDIFFNRALNNENQKFFHIQLWNDYNGKPKNLIHEEKDFRVEYGTDGLNNFHRYFLDEPQVISTSRFGELRYYVGLEQTTSSLLNVGFDRNNNKKQNTFYYFYSDTANMWRNTMYDGALMIRPVFGNAKNIQPKDEKSVRLNVFPNPVNGNVISLQADEDMMNDSHFQIFNVSGIIVQEEKTIHHINISQLPSGVYVLRLTGKNKTEYTRFIVYR